LNLLNQVTKSKIGFSYHLNTQINVGVEMVKFELFNQ